MDNPRPLPRRYRQPALPLSEFFAELTKPLCIARMGDVTAASAVRLSLGHILIDHMHHCNASNKMLVSTPNWTQFLQRYIRGYDHDHWDYL